MSASTRSRLARLRPARRASDATLRRYTVVPSRAVRGYRSAVVDSATFQNGTLFPFLARVAEPAGARMRLWLHADDEQAVAPDDLGLSPRVQRRLNLEPSADVVLGLPGQALLTVRTPGATDLPTGAAVQVSPATYQALSTGNHVRRRALLTTGDRVVLPVKLMTRPISDDAVLVPMSLRTLGGFKPGTEVQLTAIPRRPLREQLTDSSTRVLQWRPRRALARASLVALGYLLLVARLLDVVAEFLLRVAFRSQPLTFRVVQAHPGDDDLRDTIRLHPSAFSTLGLRPGGQVLLHWGGKRMAVRALEDQKPFDGALSGHVLASVGLRLDSSPLPPDFPAHLVVRIPAPIRGALNIPPNTIIELRRKLRPALQGQLNQLTVPVAGLVAAAAALPEVRGWPLVIGGLLAVGFGLAPLRMPRPPRGPWP